MKGSTFGEPKPRKQRSATRRTRFANATAICSISSSREPRGEANTCPILVGRQGLEPCTLGLEVRLEKGGKKWPQLGSSIGSPHPRLSPWFSATLDTATTRGSRRASRPRGCPGWRCAGKGRSPAGEHSLSLGLTPASRALPGEPAAARSRLPSRTHPAGFEPVHSAWTSSSTVSTTGPPAVTCEREKRGATPGWMDPFATR